MAIVSIQTLPEGTTKESVSAVSATIMAGGVPAGSLSHAIYEDGDRLISVDLWESADAMNAFRDDRLIPAIAEFARSMGMDPSQMPVAEPPRVYPVVEHFSA